MAQNLTTSKNPGQLPICPECGKSARGTLAVVDGVTLVHTDPETGKPVYLGETAINWNSPRTCGVLTNRCGFAGLGTRLVGGCFARA